MTAGKLFLALLASASAQSPDPLIHLDGSGTTNPSKYFWQILSIFEARAKPAIAMTYRAVGSSTGQFEFMGKENPAGAWTPYSDFGSGDMPFNKANYDEMQLNNMEVLQVPFSLGAMSFFDNVPDEYNPEGGVQMTSCVLAKIFSAQITTWDDKEILDLNDGFKPPAGEPIVVYHRTLGSSTTKGITQYLEQSCPNDWKLNGNPIGSGSTVDWSPATKEVQGSGGMSAAISTTEWSIGYIDAGHGIRDGLGEVAICNQAKTCQKVSAALAGNSEGVKAAADQALKSGVMPSEPSADFSAVSLMNQPGTITWPIVAISYLYINADQTETGTKGPILKAFVEYVLSGVGQLLLEEYSFVGVPEDVLEVGKKAVDEIRLDPEEDEWIFETTTIKGGGQENFVLSVKRRSYYEYELGQLEDAIMDHEDEHHGHEGDEDDEHTDGDHDHELPDHDHDEDYVKHDEFDALEGRVNTLQAEIDILNDENAALKKQMSAMEASMKGVEDTCKAGCGDHSHKNKGAKKSEVKEAMAVAAAGVAIGLLGLLIAMISCCRVNKLVSNRSPETACVPGGGRKDQELEIQARNGNGNGHGGMQRGFDKA